ncbi:MAG: ArsR family transcriptional regulator [Candidatus Thermoplasmatota archaeon]|nr:ArsR family transcriptional regulator [Candidatus Thermoplasmatota archaeon]
MSDTDKESRIFSNDSGVVVIESKTKNRIIDILKEGEKHASQIREELGKAKSTTSVHLSDLKDLGIIDEKEDSKDERKKIFYLSSQLLGKSEHPQDEHYRDILESLKDSSGKRYEFLKGLFHLLRHGLDSFGLDIHPALKEIGRDAGRAIGEDMSVNSRNELFREVSDFWDSTGLGKMKVNGDKELIVEECFDCCEMPEVGHTLCSLDEGMLEGVIEVALGEEVEVIEEECHGSGADHCKFKIEWT